MKYIYDDGGRAAAGYRGKCGDCVSRAVAIATEQPYEQVYVALATVNANTRQSIKRSKSAGRRTARNGIFTRAAPFRRYMETLGWVWTPTMGIGTGCTTHLTDGELPAGRLIVRVSKHVCAVIDGVIHDTYNPSERGVTIYPPDTSASALPKNATRLENGSGWAYAPARCVYGYWSKSGPAAPGTTDRR